MSRTSSADPHALDRFRVGSEAIGDTVLRSMGAAVEALDGLRGSVGVPASSALVDGLYRAEAAHRRLTRWVGDVATAFRTADGGPAPTAPLLDDTRTRRLAALLEAAQQLVLDHRLGAIGTLVAADALDRADAPDRVRAVAALLSPADLRALVRADPGAVGPVDGWPVAARFEANRLLIERDLVAATGRRRTALEALLHIDPRTGLGRQILRYDGSGDGRVVEVFGDLDAARDVVVFVPGMANDLDHFDSRVSAPAHRLYDEALAANADRPIAVLAWLDYDSPDPVPSLEVISRRPATQGAQSLRATLDGLFLGDRQHVSLVAHSYGTVLVAEALRGGARADDVLVMGSPGLPRARQFHRGEDTHFFTMAAPGDLVPQVRRFGPDPNQPDSGYTRLEAGGHGHSSYLADGSVSLLNATAVVRDDDAGLDRRDPNLLERATGGVARADAPRRWVDTRIDEVQRSHPAPAVDPVIDIDQLLLRLPAMVLLPGGTGGGLLPVLEAIAGDAAG